MVTGLITAPWTSPTAQATPFNYKHLSKIQKRLMSGSLAWELAPRTNNAKTGGGGDPDAGDGPDGLPDTPPASYAKAGASASPGNYIPRSGANCSDRHGNNIKVNQNCLNVSDSDLQGRGQANNETSIAQDALHPNHLVASDNDYVLGDGSCGAAYSTDRGRSWSDSLVPAKFTRGFQNNARQYWQGGGDTSVAWDTRGNAYLSCQLFNRGIDASGDADQSSAMVVFRSTDNGGASWNFPGRYLSSNYDPAGTTGVFEDKQLLAVDANRTSPYRDRVYVTWTEFAADGSAYIYESHSSDYGETFSPRVLVSSTNSLCVNTFGAGTPNGPCNENQDSDPFVGPDGALYVVFENYNNAVTGQDNRNQMLVSKSVDGGASFSSPVKVGDFYDLPDCQTYQGDDAGRACVPEKGSSTRSVFRANNYPSGSVNPRHPHQIAITYGSYINRHSNESNGCTPTGFDADFGTNLYTGVKIAGSCNNDILVSVSTNGGASFTGTATDPRSMPTVTGARSQRTTDQFWQWSTYSTNGTLVVSYYDRSYGRDEFNGSSDISLSGSRDLVNFRRDRVTSSSMPAPTQFYGTNGGAFYGDYTQLAVTTEAHPIWMDTRSTDLFLCPTSATGAGNPPRLCTATEPNGQRANDQDAYTATVRIPPG